MLSATAKPPSSKAKAWGLILLALLICLLLAAFFDLPSQFKLRQAANQLASGAAQKLFQPRRPAAPHPYRVEPAQDQN